MLNPHYKKKFEVELNNITDPLKHNLVLQLCRSQNKDVSFSTETNIKLYQIHHIKNNWLGVIFFLFEIVTQKDCFVLFHVSFERNTKVDTDLKGRFASFKVTPSNDRVLCDYTLSGYSTRQQLLRGRFFEEL